MTSLYIHIPFCKRKCNYCDFVSYANQEELIDDYVGALIKELTTYDLRPTTIYFGGGTPTLLKIEHFRSILSSLSLADCRELTIEANPGTVNKAYLKELRQLGINRLSLGVQTFNDQHLKTLGRIHDSKQIFEAVEDARAAGFDNLNLDLIFALPDQTLEDWKSDLKTAASLKPEHLSTYNLQIEEGTPLFNSGHKINEELDGEMYEYSIDTLTANGYQHYEISNFTRPGKECRHNINYWKNGDYIGIGAGAHSHFNGKRWANTESINEYIDCGTRDLEDSSATDTIFMGLRLLEGLPIEMFQGQDSKVDPLLEDGLLIRNNGHLKLSRRGLMLANLVFEKFI